jgi:hypothetical protein
MVGKEDCSFAVKPSFSCHKDWQVFVTSVRGKILDYSILHRLGTLLSYSVDEPFGRKAIPPRIGWFDEYGVVLGIIYNTQHVDTKGPQNHVLTGPLRLSGLEYNSSNLTRLPW